MIVPVVVVLAALLTYAVPAGAQEAVQERLDELRARYVFPGATVAWAGAEGRVEARATGWADPHSGTPMTPQSRMLAASIGKSFVAAAVLALRADGRLELDGGVFEALESELTGTILGFLTERFAPAR